MTAKHRKGKSNHKHEDNFFKNEVMEAEARAGANNYALHLVLFLMIVICGATGAWFSYQQHQTLTYLTDNLMGIQMKIVKLQSSHEEMRQSSSKLHVSENLETRLNALEASNALAQKQVGMALATAEQLRTSDLPAQVLSLHTEMKARLAEMQQATVSLEQLSQLQTMLKGKSEEFEGVRIQVEGLATLSAELSKKVEVSTGSLGEAESKLEEKFGQVSELSATVDGQAAEVLGLKEQLDVYQAQLQARTLEITTVRELLEREQSQRLQQAKVEEQLDALRQSLQDQSSAARSLTSGIEAQLEDIQRQVTQLVGKTQPSTEPEKQTDEGRAPSGQEEAAAANEGEQQTLPAGVEKEVSKTEGERAGEGEPAAQDEAPAEQEDSVTDEAAPAEEAETVKDDQTEQDESGAASVKENVGTAETAEGGQSTEEEVPEEEAPEGVQEDSRLEKEEQKDVVAEEEGQSEEEATEGVEEESVLEEEGDEELQHVEGREEEVDENSASPDDE